jgi:vacuolar-type H+-ATPase subunit E/Vma4
MSPPDETATADALAPVRAALLAAAHRDAGAARERSRAAAAGALETARREAERVRSRAREEGAEDAAAAFAAERSRARREAHAVVLAARREAYDSLCAAARAAMADLRGEPGYALVRQHMAAAARRLLGPDAELSEGVEGGVVGVAAGRRIDLSLAGFADRAVDVVAADDQSREDGAVRPGAVEDGPAADAEVTG